MALSPGQVKRVERVINAYPHERAIVRRVLRRHGRLHERGFDRIFGRDNLSARANRLGYFLLRGDSPILGLSLGGPMGNWKQWLDLTQHMIAAGEVDVDEAEDGGAVYSLVETH